MCELLKSLVNLASGVIASEEIQRDLLQAYALGEVAANNFIRDRLETSKEPFYNPISREKLRTFSSNTQTKVKVSKQDIVLKADRAIFVRLLVVAQTRSVDLGKLFTYSLGPIPWSLANADGTLAKTVKSKLLGLIEPGTLPVETVPAKSVWILDGMALLQGLSSLSCNSTFAHLADQVFSRATFAFKSGSSRIDFVVDQYPAISIKACERSRRLRSGSLRTAILHSKQSVPKQWKKYLSNGENKTELAIFLCQEWKNARYASALLNKQLYATSGSMCYCLTSSDGKTVTSHEVESLSGCSHEEADTRILLHGHHAALHYGVSDISIIIKSPDTDVAILACMMCSMDCNLRVFFQTGTKERSRLLPVHSITAKLGNDVCTALVGLHAFTGCDSKSAFVRKGKQKAFKLVLESPSHLNTMRRLGHSFSAVRKTTK